MDQSELLTLAQLSRHAAYTYHQCTADNASGNKADFKVLIGADNIDLKNVPVLGRTQIKNKEAVFLILPTGDPQQAVAIPFTPDQKLLEKIESLENRLSALENRS